MAGYLYRSIEVSEDTVVRAFVGADQGAKIWLNGEMLCETHQAYGFHPYDRAVSLPLKSGVNHLLVKVIMGKRGDWLFRMAPFEAPTDDVLRSAIARGQHPRRPRFSPSPSPIHRTRTHANTRTRAPAPTRTHTCPLPPARSQRRSRSPLAAERAPSNARAR